MSEVGSDGVGVFFIISGYLFSKNKRTMSDFFKQKIEGIFIPWITTGTAVYLYVVLRKEGIVVSDWINFIMGNDSYLYYLSLLILFYIIFFHTSKNTTFIVTMFVLSVISILLTAAGVIEGINNYLNPLNFIGYFSVGLLINNADNLLELAFKCGKHKVSILAFYILSLVAVISLNIPTGYWGYGALVMQLSRAT